MCHSLLADASFWRQLQRLDEQIAAAGQARGLPALPGRAARCALSTQGVRCRSGAARRGLRQPAELLLCARGLSPAHDPGVGALPGPAGAFPVRVVLLVCALTQDLSRRRRARLGARLGVSERTLERWRRWWRSTLPATPWWRAARARFVPPPEARALPASLLARFGVPTSCRGPHRGAAVPGAVFAVVVSGAA